MSDDLDLTVLPPVPLARTPYPARAGNAVTPWVDGVPFYERLQRALNQARRSVWTTVSFVERDFCFPDGSPLWEALDACAARGVDVRALFWHSEGFARGGVFVGDARDRELLRVRGAGCRARWDASPDRAHCHHQKSWVVDAGQPGEVAFVGGMILSRATLQTPAHDGRPDSKHDLFFEVAGPAAHDVAHNFVQRWNHARQPAGVPPWPDAAAAGPLDLPSTLAPPRGPATVQVSRTLRPGLYPATAEVAGGRPYDSGQGEEAVWLQYQAAFEAARDTIYIENQHPGEHLLLGLLDQALARGVQVVYVVPGEPMPAIVHARRAADRAPDSGATRYAETFARLGALGRHPNFVLAALATSRAEGGYTEIYTHGKVCVVDGAWATCGSANLVDLSLARDHTELNVSVWHAETSLRLLRRLVEEHTGQRLERVDPVGLLAAFADAARANVPRRRAGAPLVGRCYALDPAGYGRVARGQPLAPER